MDNRGARTGAMPRVYTGKSNSEEQPTRISGGRSGSNFSGHINSDVELPEDATPNARVRNSTSGAHSDGEINGAGSVLGSAGRQPESGLQEHVVKGSVDNGYHGSKADKLPSASTPSSFEKQNGSGNPSSAKAACENNKNSPMKQAVPYFKLFKYADRVDILLMTLGTGMAVLDGFTWPIIAYIQSILLNKFASTASPKQAYDDICRFTLYLVYSSIFSMVVSYFEVWCWMYTGERQAGRIRAKYVHAILRQDVGFFDTQGGNIAAIVASVSADTLLLQDAISEKVGNTVQNLALLVGGVVVGLLLCWRVTLAILPSLPFLLLPGLMYGRALLGLAVRIQVSYGSAGTIAQQAISSIRTVYSFVGEQRILETYSNSLESSVSLGKKQGLAKGLAIGLTAQTFLVWAFVCWWGTYQVVHGYSNGGSVVFGAFIVLYAGLGLGSITPNIKCFLEGRVAAYRIFQMIDRVPPIDVENVDGRTLEKVQGNIELCNVDFAYPSRMEAPIFKNFSINIPAGKTVALVGSSGSGKSTVIALIERFYDPVAGRILIDGFDIKDLQLKWLRRQIGLVSQEPALFATTVFENIRYGKESATMEEIIEAAKSANAHNFISKLPNGYHTQVGERGVQMSGGQKQRIAIARTIIKSPSILLLDEATSALDTESEMVVQQALERAAMNRTTVIVAHRLSTIRNADLIAVLQHGKIVETGSHEDLLRKGETGAYYSLINLQNFRKEKSSTLSESKPQGSVDNGETPVVDPVFSEVKVLSSKDDSEGYFGEYADTKRDVSPDKIVNPSFSRILMLNKPEWKQGLLGLLGGVGFGFTNPFYAFIIASLVVDYYRDLTHEQLWHNIRKYVGALVGLAVFFIGTNLLQHYNFASAGEYLTKRVREQMLESILKFEVGWFDKDENSSGSVCSRLASDANMVRSLIGDRISLLTGSLSMVFISWVLCFIISWRFGVLIIFLHPLVIFCYYIKKALLMRFAKETAIAQAEASQVASEGVAQHRTITAFSAQEKVQVLFESKLEGPRRQMLHRSQVAGVTLGVANFVSFASMALVYWYGGLLNYRGQGTFGDFFKVFLIFVNTSRTIGEAGAMTPDFAKASIAINSVFQILDRKTKIDSDVRGAEEVDTVKGDIEFMDVYFAYPSRPDVMVFRGFNLQIHAGQTVAMVGQSGSGKSTIVGLIERFYDPRKGTIYIDGKDLSKVNLKSVRRHISLVNQEPTLFAMSIRDNIAYGKEGATDAEIIEAATAANAHNFIRLESVNTAISGGCFRFQVYVCNVLADKFLRLQVFLVV
ncbi:hypothetical protein KC19_4G257500 [Ceratodon purpureus]|uniref:Uncharacterized protein n=1 Tax=Ceratodon purpureus TaxID=3225 RepID=A0A8T0IDN4_CERPU|nr:hypothetical protein KC19_4G257500 [Ceratodon purpureus]KAG0581514.1 hypothetical protein KC19_4G257500 [Ceratodon purpureus]